ncbi:family 43 glycosylhydrolase [Candidatus Latescibacterota bacterium]
MTFSPAPPFAGFGGFTYTPAMPREEGVTRRDPSPVVAVADTFYVWYSRTTSGPDGYSASVWWASSTDGHTWVEGGEALGRGSVGAFDEHAVFTPTILVSEGQYYLVYTAVPEPFTNDGGRPGGTRTAIGVAVAHSPAGPWVRLGNGPVVGPGDDPEDFDSHRVDDACLLVREGKYWLYYKGRQMGRTPGETRMGLAIAESPIGPYAKWEGNPVLDSGHEVCVWPHGPGVACLVSSTGPQGNTLQYSDDGLHFRRCVDAPAPKAPGPYRADHFREGVGPGITWGLCQHLDPKWPYLERFDCDLRYAGERIG